MTKFLQSLFRDSRGATAIEYGLILAFVFLAIAAAVSQFSDTNQAIWENIATKMAQN